MKHPNSTLSEYLEGSKHHTTTIAPTPPTCTCVQNASNKSALEFIQSATANPIGKRAFQI